MRKDNINKVSIVTSILFLGVASVIQMINELAFHFFNRGGLKEALSGMPGATIGFFEAHGLASIWVIYFIAKFRQRAYVETHVFASAVHFLLGTANSIFWNDSFVRFDMIMIGWISTILHFVLVMLHLISLKIKKRN